MRKDLCCLKQRNRSQTCEERVELKEGLKIRYQGLLSRRDRYQGLLSRDRQTQNASRGRKGRAGVLHCIILYFGRDIKMKSIIVSSIKQEIKSWTENGGREVYTVLKYKHRWPACILKKHHSSQDSPALPETLSFVCSRALGIIV